MKEKDIIEELAYKLLFAKSKINLKDKETGEEITTINIVNKYMTNPEKNMIILSRSGTIYNKDEKMAMLNNFIDNEKIILKYFNNTYIKIKRIPTYIINHIFMHYINNDGMIEKLFKQQEAIYNEDFINKLKVSDDIKKRLNTILILAKLN